jgi:murein DD-endopeptidase MepM/ murein hydrolase activator NlpD
MNRSRWSIAVAAVVILLGVGGLRRSPAQPPAGAQSTKIIDRVSRLELEPDPNIPLPRVYTEPPQIIEQVVGGESEWKLFYFCKYHTSDELRQIVHEQFATKIFDKKGKSTRMVDYTVTSSPATNQLIVRCPHEEDVEAVLQLLERVDVPPIQVKIDCLVSEIYADKTLDHETTLQIKDLFGEDVTLTPGGMPFGEDVQELLKEGGTALPAFPGASLREVSRARMGLQIGYMSTSHEFTALVDILESQGYLKILMRPSLEVVNGKTASVEKSEHVPLQKITKTVPGAGGTTVVATQTEYVDVKDRLEITPHVFADGTIGLETTILLGSKSTPEGVKQIPITTKKEIDNKGNRIRRGESLIIGGIRKSEKRDVIRGVPILKDIPLLGILFSGRDFEERVVETVFILTPTISTGGVPREDILEKIKEKHEPPVSASDKLQDKITDPFGSGAREKQRQQKLHEAERERSEAQAETAEARAAAREAEAAAQRAKTQTVRVEEKAVTAEKAAQAEIDKAKTEAEQATTQAKSAREEIEKLKAQIKKAEEKAAAAEKRAQEEIQKARAEAEQAKKQAKKPKPDNNGGKKEEGK